MEWLYRFIRRRTKPIPRYTARLYHDRLSIAYYMLAWTAGGLALMEMLTYDPTVLPDELNVHADHSSKVSPSVYRTATKVNYPEDTVGIRVVSMRNFKLQSVEDIDIKDVQDKLTNTKKRQKNDFYGDEEHDELQNEEEKVVELPKEEEQVTK